MMNNRLNRKTAVTWAVLWATLSPALAFAAAQNITLQAGGPASAAIGTPFAWTVSISNLGTADSSGTLIVTDALDPAVTLNSIAAATGWACSASGQMVTCTSADVVPTQTSAKLVASISVTAAQVGPGYVRNTATVSGASVGGQNNKTASPVVTALEGPTDAPAPADLSAVTSGPATGVVGTQFPYMLSVANSGGSATQGAISVTYTAPAGLAPVTVVPSANFGCAMNGATVTCTSNAAIGAASGNLTAATVNVMPLQPGTFSNTSTVSGGGDASPGNNTSAAAVTVVASAPVVTPPPPDVSRNYGGIWWGAPAGSESGWGINFAHQADTIFATWYTYGADGNQMWLVVAANRTGPHRYAGNLYTTTGPSFSSRFDPSKVVAEFAGTALFDFDDNSNATFTSTVDGIVMVKRITREIFATPATTCVYGADPTALALATNYQDMWWANPAGSEAGWGLNIAHQGNTIFATWFTYDVDGSPMWLVASGTRNALGSYSGTLYRTRGPAFNSTPFNPADVTATVVGTMKLTFANGNLGTFAYTLNGVTQSKTITREVFAEYGTVCH